MPLHPQAAAALARSPSVWRDLDAIASMTARKARAIEAHAKVATDLPPDVVMEELEIPGATAPLRGGVYHPRTQGPVGTVLWIRGGGFVVGSLDTERMPGLLARASGCAVVSVEYRLAPEHPFPAGLEDCYAALQWVSAHAQGLGRHAHRVAIGGESAGGNLAAAAALMSRDRGGPEIALQVLLVPLLIRTFDSPSRRDPTVGVLARSEAIEWLWEQYLGDRDEHDPLACPLHARSLAGLPPAVVFTAEYDVLRDEGEAYAERLRRAGVPVRLRRFDGMHHGFTDSPGAIDAADECVASIGEALRRVFSSSQ